MNKLRGRRSRAKVANALNIGEQNFLTLYGLRITGEFNNRNATRNRGPLHNIEVKNARCSVFWLNRNESFVSWRATAQYEDTRPLNIDSPEFHRICGTTPWGGLPPNPWDEPCTTTTPT